MKLLSMKKLFLIFSFLIFINSANGQDKIITKYNDTIKCKIINISEKEITYKLQSFSTNFTINAENVKNIHTSKFDMQPNISIELKRKELEHKIDFKTGRLSEGIGFSLLGFCLIGISPFFNRYEIKNSQVISNSLTSEILLIAGFGSSFFGTIMIVSNINELKSTYRELRYLSLISNEKGIGLTFNF